ncbi:MAG: SET domain-containing protein [Candidatus Paceibacterota bacterium]
MKIYLKKSKIHGLGIFALEDIATGEVIETCPVLILSKKDTETIDKTELYNYYFSWKNQTSALALGFGSIYNHAYIPNARYKTNYLRKQIIFIATKDINKDQEITVNYNGDPLSQNKVWFEK